MKLAILAVFLFVAAAASLPVEQPKDEVVAVEAAPEQAQEKAGADDLSPEESHWGGWGGHYYRPIHYGGWGGSYYRPYYGSGYGGYGWGYPSYGYGWRRSHYW